MGVDNIEGFVIFCFGFDYGIPSGKKTTESK
jgi:hypothetical protein